MLNIVLLLMASALFVEGTTELICKSSIFFGIRTKLSSVSAFFKQLLGCGYCTSVWVSFLPAALITLEKARSIPELIVMFVFLTVVIHRLSNFVHNINDKHFDKFYDKRMNVKDVN